MASKILSIGTNKFMNYLIKTVLAEKFPVIIVEDVFYGMNLLKQSRDIWLVIVDIDCQTKESIDFILHIDSSELYTQRIIILSNDQNHKINKSLINSCAYDYFIKPFNPIDLVTSIKKLSLIAV